MKFLDKWKELTSVILSEITQSQKNTHGSYALTDKGILAQKLKINKIHRPQEAQEEERPEWGWFGSSEKGNKILTGAIMETKCG